MCMCNIGLNNVMQNVFWLVDICFAILLHKPSHNEQSQNRFYGVQTPMKLMQIIVVDINRTENLLQMKK
jgi:hypothetical protein